MKKYIITEDEIKYISNNSVCDPHLYTIIQNRGISECVTCKHNSGMPQKPCTLVLEMYPDSLQIGIPFYMDILGCGSYEKL